MLRATGGDQRQTGNKSDDTGPQEGAQVLEAVVDHQRDHGHDHGDGQRDQEYADNETDDAKGRQRHVVTLTCSRKGAILPAAYGM